MSLSPRSKLSFLGDHPFFASLAQSQIAQLARISTIHDYARGEVIDLEGEPCRAVYFVLSGSIRAVITSSQGREQVVNTLWPGQAFHMVPAVENTLLPATTEAARRSRLLRIPAPEWRGLLETHPAVTLCVLSSFAKRLRQLSSLIGDLSLRSVPERLARLLLVSAMGEQGRLTQREMAARVGTVREVVARALATFEREGWIEMERGRIEIIDQTALTDLAEM